MLIVSAWPPNQPRLLEARFEASHRQYRSALLSFTVFHKWKQNECFLPPCMTWLTVFFNKTAGKEAVKTPDRPAAYASNRRSWREAFS
jgi:hypothetical protein